ncbi:MAG: hypothetical protein AAB378_01725 [Patescibacteria group bacterium]
MEKGYGTKPGAKQDYGWLILFLLILAVMWYSQGGKFGNNGIILEPPSSVSQSPASETKITAAPPQQETTISSESPYKNQINIVADAVRATNPNEEYITLAASYGNKESINITGWTLANKSGTIVKIGQGSYLPYSAQVNPQTDIRLEPGGKALILTGTSPISTNFQLNACTGYFNQFQNFFPRLPEQCSYPKNLIGLYEMKDDVCIAYIEKLPRCRMPQNIPLLTKDACRAVVESNFSYAGCVANEENKEKFYSKEWRIYLNKDAELWKDKYEKIMLTDRDDKTVYELSY